MTEPGNVWSIAKAPGLRVESNLCQEVGLCVVVV